MCTILEGLRPTEFMKKFLECGARLFSVFCAGPRRAPGTAWPFSAKQPAQCVAGFAFDARVGGGRLHPCLLSRRGGARVTRQLLPPAVEAHARPLS